jgi:cellulose biosynthesis protein BcsQ
MALESIPLTAESVAYWAGAASAGATAAWAVAHFLYKHRLEDLCRQHEQRQEDLSRKVLAADQRSTTYADEVDRKTRQIAHLDDQLAEVKARVASLEKDLEGKTNPNAEETIKELRHQLARLDDLRSAIEAEDDSLWHLREEKPPVDFAERMEKSTTKVVTVINYKGGVGKTTIATGLAAYLAARDKRVLVIDFDYQGSLTRTLVLGSRVPLGSFIKADRVIGGKITGRELAELGHDLGATLRGTRLVTSGQTFDGFEFRMMLSWLLGECEDDVRYRLAHLVLSDAVQKEFDYVLIDAPPRASTGAINAICASHALIVPTVLDNLSVDAAALFLARTNASFRPLNPALHHVGLIATLTKAGNLNRPERDALDELKKALPLWGDGAKPFDARLRHFQALTAAAGSDIAYLRDRGVKAAFDAIGDELVKVLHENKAVHCDSREHRSGVREERRDQQGGVAAPV